MDTSALVEEYLNDCRAYVEPGTVESYRQRLQRFTGWIGSRTPDRSNIKDWVAWLLTEEQLSNQTVRLYRQTLRQFFTWCEEEGHCKHNPVSTRMRIEVGDSDRTPITEEEHERILAIAEDPFDYGVQCGWNTGLRLSDVATLKWDNVDLTEKVITITPSKTKRYNKVLTIPINTGFTVFLTEVRLRQGPNSDSPYVCPHMALQHAADRHMTLSGQFSSLFRKAGVEKSFHCYRHAFVTRLLEKDINPLVIASMTGHSLKEIQRYAHPSIETKRKAIA